MPLQVPSTPDPTSATPAANAYAAIVEFHLSSYRQTVQFTIGYFRSAADYQGHVIPFAARSYSIGPNPETRADGATIPGYGQVLGLATTQAGDPPGTLAFAIVSRTIEGFLAGLPEFAGASTVG